MDRHRPKQARVLLFWSLPYMIRGPGVVKNTNASDACTVPFTATGGGRNGPDCISTHPEWSTLHQHTSGTRACVIGSTLAAALLPLECRPSSFNRSSACHRHHGPAGIGSLQRCLLILRVLAVPLGTRAIGCSGKAQADRAFICARLDRVAALSDDQQPCAGACVRELSHQGHVLPPVGRQLCPNHFGWSAGFAGATSTEDGRKPVLEPPADLSVIFSSQGSCRCSWRGHGVSPPFPACAWRRGHRSPSYLHTLINSRKATFARASMLPG